MNDIIASVKPELLVVAVVLYFIGMALKRSKLKDNYIPLILGFIGVVAGVIYCGVVEGWNVANVVSGVFQGLLTAASSTYVNQVIKQLQKLNVIDDNVAGVLENIVDKVGEGHE